MPGPIIKSTLIHFKPFDVSKMAVYLNKAGGYVSNYPVCRFPSFCLSLSIASLFFAGQLDVRAASCACLIAEQMC